MKTERWTECLLGVLLCLAGALVTVDAGMEPDWLRMAVGVCLLLSGVFRILPHKAKRKEDTPCEK